MSMSSKYKGLWFDFRFRGPKFDAFFVDRVHAFISAESITLFHLKY